MNFKEALRIAWRNLTHRKIRSWLTLLGIFAGIAAVVALISLGQGLQGAIQDQFSSLGTNLLTLQGAGSSFGPPGTNAVGKLSDHDVDIISRVNGVDFAFGRYLKPALLSKNKKESIGVVASLPEGENFKVMLDALNLKIDKGRFINPDDSKKVTIGATADIDGQELPLGSKFNIKGEVFAVAGILKKKGNPIFDNAILMTTKSIEELFDVKNDYSIIVIELDPETDLKETQDVIERKLRRDRNQNVGEEDFEISSAQETLDSLNSILLTVQVLLAGIAAISLLVGAIGITNTMFTSILERRREIGIMKSIGAKNSDIQLIFLLESGLLGLSGGIIGLVLGTLISKGVELGVMLAFGESLIKAVIPWWLAFGALTFALLLGTISGTLPARKASQLKPVEALKQ